MLGFSSFDSYQSADKLRFVAEIPCVSLYLLQAALDLLKQTKFNTPQICRSKLIKGINWKIKSSYLAEVARGFVVGNQVVLNHVCLPASVKLFAASEEYQNLVVHQVLQQLHHLNNKLFHFKILIISVKCFW